MGCYTLQRVELVSQRLRRLRLLCGAATAAFGKRIIDRMATKIHVAMKCGWAA